MLINKLTVGYVTQVWDTEKDKFVSQSFTASDEVAYEVVDFDGEKADPIDEYHHFDMIQPKPTFPTGRP